MKICTHSSEILTRALFCDFSKAPVLHVDFAFFLTGHNWGMPEFEGGIMSFEIGKAAGFEIPLPYVNQCIAGKNEATLEFHLNEDAPVNLSEMRFFIPGTDLAGDDPVEDWVITNNVFDGCGTSQVIS